MKLWRVHTIERARVGADPKHDRLRIDAWPFKGDAVDADGGPLIAVGSVIACDMLLHNRKEDDDES